MGPFGASCPILFRPPPLLTLSCLTRAVILITMMLYVLVGKEILRRSRELRSISNDLTPTNHVILDPLTDAAAKASAAQPSASRRLSQSLNVASSPSPYNSLVVLI